MKYLLILLVIILSINSSYGQKRIDKRMLSKQAPDSFRVIFTTTKGTIIVVAHRSWSPKAVDRFYQLVKAHYYDGVAVFRVQKGFVAQFGISNDTARYSFWNNHKVADEPVIEKNTKGTISFARSVAETRTTQLFINLNDNPRLDTYVASGIAGYPPIAKITKGIEITEMFNGEYGFKPAEEQDSIAKYGNAYLKLHYPKLDYILKAKVLNN